MEKVDIITRSIIKITKLKNIIKFKTRINNKKWNTWNGKKEKKS